MQLIGLSESCRNCYKCVRNCPVKAIRYQNYSTEIIKDRCVFCGDCFVACPQNAGYIESDIESMLEAVASNKRVIACVDPYFSGYYSPKGSFVTALKEIGIDEVYEVGLGAFHVIQSYEKYIEENQPDYAISAFCPSINLLIKKYYPELLPYIFPVLSPMLAMGKYLKEDDPDCYTVYFGPCLSKKYERTATGDEVLIDAVITFDQIQKLFLKNRIRLEELPETVPDKITTRTGRAYAVKNGISNAFRTTLEKHDYNIFCVDGIERVRDLLEIVREQKLDKSYLELYACTELCLNGPCPPRKSVNMYDTKQNIRNFIRDGWGDAPETVLDFSHVDLHTEYNPIDLHIPKATEEDIKNALKTMDIESKKDELNCGACGYDTCRAKAESIVQGMSESSMCIHLMRTSAEYLSQLIVNYSPNGIILTDDQLQILDFNPAAAQMFRCQAAEVKGKPLSCILDDGIAQGVLQTERNVVNRRIVYEEFNLVTVQSISYVRKYNIVMMIISDVTADEKRAGEMKVMKENTLDIAQRVIDKQMMIAQEIASLLGETTAETKVALNKLKNIVIQEEGESGV